MVSDWNEFILQRRVIAMKSVKYMPFFLSFFQFLNGGVWSAYALVVKDYYIGVSFFNLNFNRTQLFYLTNWELKNNVGTKWDWIHIGVDPINIIHDVQK